MKSSEILADHIPHPVLIELEVIPGLGIGYHIPAQGITAVQFDQLERVNVISQTLGHFIAVFVEYQTI